jgi:DNA-binding CsgD family transcriptional regulator/transposase-like protein
VCRLRKLNVDIEEFKRLHADGMTNKEIANILGFSQDTARRIRCNLGLSPLVRDRKSTVAVVIDDKEFKKLFEKGLSDEEIGKFFGISVNTIFKHRQSLGLSRWKKWEKTASNIEKFKKLHSEGLNDKKIGNVFGISISTARKIRYDLGLPSQPLSRKYVDTEELKRYLAKELTDKEIGAIFGVSAYTVYERRRDLGLFRHKKQIRFENINMDDFKKLYTENMNDVKIAKALDIQDQKLIREIRHHLGLAPNQGWFHERKRELYDIGMSDKQIAKIIKGNKKSVAAWRRNHGLPLNKPDDSLNVVLENELLKLDENGTIQPDSKSFICDREFIENDGEKCIKMTKNVNIYSLKDTNIDELKKLFTIGFSDTEISKLFGVSDRTISNRRRGLGLYKQKPRQKIKRKNVDIEEFKKLYFAGMNDIEIGKVINIPPSAVFGLRHQLGLSSNRGKRHWEMRGLYDSGVSDSKIAETLKVKKQAVTAWRQSHKLPPNDYDDMVNDVCNVKLSKPEEEEPIQMDSESLFYDTEFLENYLGKEIN